MIISSASKDEGKGASTSAVVTLILLTAFRHLCHCLNCKKVSGSLFGSNLTIEEEKVTFTGEGLHLLRLLAFDFLTYNRQLDLVLRPRNAQ